MKTCPNCGRMYSDMVTVCQACNTALNGQSGASANNSYNSGNNYSSNNSYNSGNNYNSNHNTQTISYSNNNQNTAHTQNTQTAVAVNDKDKGGFLWGVPGFFIPIVGLIMYFCMKKKRPNCASAALKGAAIGFTLNMVLTFIGI